MHIRSRMNFTHVFSHSSRYIIKEKVAGAEGVSYRYKLGVRSQTETTKRKILEFISEVWPLYIFARLLSIDDFIVQYTTLNL